MEKLGKREIVTGCISLLFVVIYALAMMLTKGYKLNPDKVNKLDDGWNYLSSILIKNTKGYSTYYDTEKNNVYVLTANKSITDDMRGRTLAFHTNDSYVDVYISGDRVDVTSFDSDALTESKIIYHFGKKPLFGDSPGTYTHFVYIPEDAEGVLTVRVETAYKNKFLKSYDFYIGSEKELVHAFINSDLLMLIIGCVLFISGVCIIIYCVVNKTKEKGNGIFLLSGILLVDLTVNLSCRLFFSGYILNYPIGEYYIKYISLFALSLLAAVIIKRLFTDNKLDVAIYALICLTAVIMLLHFTGFASFTETNGIYLAGMVVLVIIVMIYISRKIKRSDKSELM